MKPWGEWIQGRIQAIFEREFLLAIVFMYGVWKVLMTVEEITMAIATIITTVAGVLANFTYQRRKLKDGGS